MPRKPCCARLPASEARTFAPQCGAKVTAFLHAAGKVLGLFRQHAARPGWAAPHVFTRIPGPAPGRPAGRPRARCRWTAGRCRGESPAPPAPPGAAGRGVVVAGWMTRLLESATLASRENSFRWSMKRKAPSCPPFRSTVKMEPPPRGKYRRYRSWSGWSGREGWLTRSTLGWWERRSARLFPGVAVQAEGQGLDPLEQEEGVEGGDGRPGVPQQDGPDVGGQSGGTGGVREADPVVAGVGRPDGREAAGGLPVKGSPVHDDPTQGWCRGPLKIWWRSGPPRRPRVRWAG